MISILNEWKIVTDEAGNKVAAYICGLDHIRDYIAIHRYSSSCYVVFRGAFRDYPNPFTENIVCKNEEDFEAVIAEVDVYLNRLLKLRLFI